MTNKATGEHVQHLRPKRRRARKSPQTAPSTSSLTPSITPSNTRAPLGPSSSNNVADSTDNQSMSQNDGEKGGGAFDDELDVVWISSNILGAASHGFYLGCPNSTAQGTQEARACPDRRQDQRLGKHEQKTAQTPALRLRRHRPAQRRSWHSNFACTR
jgi:hypothetical protein